MRCVQCSAGFELIEKVASHIGTKAQLIVGITSMSLVLCHPLILG